MKLTGTLIRETFPGPPNYESVRKGDQAETYWLLRLVSPICVTEDKKSPDINLSRIDVGTIQVVVSREGYGEKKILVGRRVIATGSLFGAITGHHHTSVLLMVQTLERAPVCAD